MSLHLENAPVTVGGIDFPSILGKITAYKQITKTKNNDYYELNVYINYEIISKLLSFGDDLEVMSPPSLRDEMRGKVLKMASKYVVS